MKCVVDSNCLRDDLLRQHLSRSPSHVAVLTDYAVMEALKGDPLVGMYESMKILAGFPAQVQVLETTMTVCGLSGVPKGLQRRLVDMPRSKEFGLFCRNLAIAKQKPTPLTSQLAQRGEDARKHLARLEAAASQFAEAGVEVARLFTPAERLSIVSAHRYEEPTLRKIMSQTMLLSGILFGAHPAVRRMPSSRELINTYIFRSALCGLLLGFQYESFGGVSGKAARKIRNDMVDTHFATYATFFDGLISKDERAAWLYRMTIDVLARFRSTYLGG